ncbi:MAG: protocatechuate 3,4-dioxygenase [Burkholderiales bacterium]|nr:protocatechuate 3,4-dioxygenase [Burkholderiales bacterium]
MAQIVLGVGSSHSPMLGTPPEHWGLRAIEDKRGKHPYRDGIYAFDELVELRKAENLATQITREVWNARHEKNQQCLDYLGKRIAEFKLDVLVIIGDDQGEVFLHDNMPTFAIYTGQKVFNKKASKAHLEALPAGVAIAEWANEPAECDMEHPGAPELAEQVIDRLKEDGFDVSVSSKTPVGRFGDSGIPHAFGFYYHRILDDLKDCPQMATLPVFINCFFRPNQPSARRALNFGKSIGAAIRSWGNEQRVGIAASGGFSHFVIDEELDRRVLKAMEEGDEETIVQQPDYFYQSGTSEIKNWIAVMGAVSQAGLKFRLIDYVPCYRSLAGTGNANTFGLWT